MNSFLKVIWDLRYQLGLQESEYAEVKFIALGLLEVWKVTPVFWGSIKEWLSDTRVYRVKKEGWPQTSHFVNLHNSHSGSKIRCNGPTIQYTETVFSLTSN